MDQEIKSARGRGRPKGSPNKLTLQKRNALEPLIERGKALVEQVLDGKLPCGVCHGKGKTKFQPATHKGKRLQLGVRICQSCYGSGLERLSPAERLRAALELIEYGHAKRKAIEHSGAVTVSIAQILRDRRARRNEPASQ